MGVIRIYSNLFTPVFSIQSIAQVIQTTYHVEQVSQNMAASLGLSRALLNSYPVSKLPYATQLHPSISTAISTFFICVTIHPKFDPLPPTNTYKDTNLYIAANYHQE